MRTKPIQYLCPIRLLGSKFFVTRHIKYLDSIGSVGDVVFWLNRNTCELFVSNISVIVSVLYSCVYAMVNIREGWIGNPKTVDLSCKIDNYEPNCKLVVGLRAMSTKLYSTLKSKDAVSATLHSVGKTLGSGWPYVDGNPIFPCIVGRLVTVKTFDDNDQ